MSASHQADVMLAQAGLLMLVSQIASLGSFCGVGGWVGGLGLIIMSNLNLSRVKLILGWVVTIIYIDSLFPYFT